MVVQDPLLMAVQEYQTIVEVRVHCNPLKVGFWCHKYLEGLVAVLNSRARNWVSYINKLLVG